MRRALAVLLLLGAWHLALRRHGYFVPMMADEGEYGYAAKVWSEGGLPYKHAFTQKPPLVLWLYRLSAPLGIPLGPRVLATFFSLATMLALFLIAPRRWSDAGRLSAPAAYAALSTTPLGDYGFAAQTEVFAAGFTAFSALGAARAWESGSRRAVFLAGLLGGAALMSKQTALYSVLAIGASSLWRGERRWAVKDAPLWAAGAAVLPLFWIGYFASHGALGDFVDCALAGNTRYIAMVGPKDLLMQFSWFVRTLLPDFLKGDFLAWGLALYGLSGIYPEWEERAPTLSMLWLGTALAGAFTGLLLFPHYFLQAAPALALAAAAGVSKIKRKAWVATVLLALSPALIQFDLYFVQSPETVARRLLFPNPLNESIRIGRFLNENTDPSRPIYVFGSEAPIYLHARRSCATRHSIVYPLTMFPRSAGPIDAELAALDAAKPSAIVYSAQPLSSLIGSKHGLRFKQEIERRLEKDYLWVGEVLVERDRGLARFEKDGLPEKPSWEPGDRLLVFLREEGRVPSKRPSTPKASARKAGRAS